MIPIWGPLSSSLPAQGRSFRPSRANGKPPQQRPCHQGGPPAQSQHLRPWRRWETPHGAWGASGPLPVCLSPACCPLTGRSVPAMDPHAGPTCSVTDPLWLEVGLPVRGTAHTALLPVACTHSVLPRRGLLSFHHPQTGHTPLPSATAHHLIRLPESYPSSPLDQASGRQSLLSPNGCWASAGPAQAPGHHTGWYLAASRRTRKAQRSPYQQLPGKSL